MIIALSGGIGGAKLALGLSHVLPPEELLIIANTGDDFEHYGLTICPDTDTLLYTLAGLDNPQLGWGRADESWAFMETLAALGGQDWFRLGDRDLALHVLRRHRLRAGESLSAITDEFRRHFGIGPRILPMSDDPVRTQIGTDQGWLDFQDWFVRLRAEPLARAVKFAGVEQARPQPVLLEALRAQPRGIVICPSNPFISIEPILAVPALRDAIAASGAPVVAVSPIIAGKAVKGPTARMFEALGVTPSAAAVAARYGDLLDGYVMEHGDDTAGISPRVFQAATLMRNLADKTALARQVLAAIEALR
ncbi:MAG: 2-phospho-L-lactate transferase [Roseomonas sp.]|nr:2-phospho-L-lactate transferase [Roseomonas sp.]MCA3306215.1 2-phospho-L-lactate transferase [Roseomonas sp.]MCA3313870.1 2-phospho-L-lactate transferase [Roseomonas sp.]MCA3345080.1 2-phospho-L-lactate transferase [Roseomonas sp.]